MRAGEQRLVFDPRTGDFRPHVRVERYVRTVPFEWLRRANRLPGNTTAVAVSLWFLAGVKKCATFRLTAEAVDLAGCSRKSLYRAITALETAGLISVLRRPGARPIITINKQTLLPSAEEQAEGSTRTHQPAARGMTHFRATPTQARIERAQTDRQTP
jgi:hypothetical protein